MTDTAKNTFSFALDFVKEDSATHFGGRIAAALSKDCAVEIYNLVRNKNNRKGSKQQTPKMRAYTQVFVTATPEALTADTVPVHADALPELVEGHKGQLAAYNRMQSGIKWTVIEFQSEFGKELTDTLQRIGEKVLRTAMRLVKGDICLTTRTVVGVFDGNDDEEALAALSPSDDVAMVELQATRKGDVITCRLSGKMVAPVVESNSAASTEPAAE